MQLLSKFINFSHLQAKWFYYMLPQKILINLYSRKHFVAPEDVVAQKVGMDAA